MQNQIKIQVVTVSLDELRGMISNEFDQMKRELRERELAHELDKKANWAFGVSFGDSLDKAKTARLLQHSRVTIDKLLIEGKLERSNKGISVKSIIAYMKEIKPELLEQYLRKFDEIGLLVI